MFGLMKARCCGKDAVQREAYRLHYCGTCKTMGRLYGQRSRFLLNYDAVFLGELLTALMPPQIAFAPAYVSRNCLALPNTAQAPLTLQYAATANVLLAEFKLTDHVADTGSKIAWAARHLFSNTFRKAQKRLYSWQFPLAELHRQLQLQKEREQEAKPTLARLAEPTANATRLVFQQGAFLIGTSVNTAAVMTTLGEVFGRIAYLADALQDGDKDRKTGEFNALTATGTTAEQAKALLRTYQAEMFGCLRDLPIAEEHKMLFMARLRSNLAAIAGGPKLPMAKSQEDDEKKSRSWCDGCCTCETCCDAGCACDVCCDASCCACDSCCAGDACCISCSILR